MKNINNCDLYRFVDDYFETVAGRYEDRIVSDDQTACGGRGTESQGDPYENDHEESRGRETAEGERQQAAVGFAHRNGLCEDRGEQDQSIEENDRNQGNYLFINRLGPLYTNILNPIAGRSTLYCKCDLKFIKWYPKKNPDTDFKAVCRFHPRHVKFQI